MHELVKDDKPKAPPTKAPPTVPPAEEIKEPAPKKASVHHNKKPEDDYLQDDFEDASEEAKKSKAKAASIKEKPAAPAPATEEKTEPVKVVKQPEVATTPTKPAAEEEKKSVKKSVHAVAPMEVPEEKKEPVKEPAKETPSKSVHKTSIAPATATKPVEEKKEAPPQSGINSA